MKTFLSAAFLFLSTLAAQGQILYTSGIGAPQGTCTTGIVTYKDDQSGNLWDCVAGAWHLTAYSTGNQTSVIAAIGTGSVGPQGPQGIPGVPGTPGASGAQGETGPAGPQGNAGAAGTQGVPGPQGLTGDTGAQGPAGANGTPGAQGSQGIQGLPGVDGSAGAQGPTGNTGPVGNNGAPGAQGIQGPPGTNGTNGNPGAQGIQGVPGTNGTNGTNATAAVYSRVTGSNVTTTGQVLVDIAGLTSPLLANSVYEFEAVLSVQSSSTAGIQYGVQFSAAGATVEAQIVGTLAAATVRVDRISVLNAASPARVTVAATGGVQIRGIIVVGVNAGNLTAKHAKVTSGTATVFVNSYLKVTKIL